MPEVDRTRWDAVPIPTKVLVAGVALLLGMGSDRMTGELVLLPGTLRGVLNML